MYQSRPVSTWEARCGQISPPKIRRSRSLSPRPAPTPTRIVTFHKTFISSSIDRLLTRTMKDSLQHNEQLRMHSALILANVFFGVGGVVGALGLPASHPLSFALLREFWAGLILLGISIYLQKVALSENVNDFDTQTSKRPSDYSALLYPLLAWRVHWKSFALLGVVVFGNQAGFIVGLKMAGPVAASVWQPSQPIFTAAICMALGWEPPQPKRILGITVAFLGCISMVLLKHSNAEQDTSTAAHQHNAVRYLMGNALFFGNCLCTSLYVILSKRMLALYPALLVTAWSYNFASLCMLGVTMTAAALPGSQAFFCPECSRDEPFWHIAPGARPALLYYIVFASVGAYGLLTWANQFATGTLVMSYTVVQPCTAALLTTSLLVFGVVMSCHQGLKDEAQSCLDYPSLGTFCGMLGVFGGLALIIATERTSAHSTENDKNFDVETIPLASIEEES